MAEKKQKKVTVTRAEKKDGAKKLILEILKEGSKKSNELIDEASKRYAQAFGGEENENPNDVKGRIGSVLDVMKKEGEVAFEGGVYALKVETPVEEKQEKAKKTTRSKTKKAEKVDEKTEEAVAEKPKKTRKTTKAKKTEPNEQTEEIIQPVPPAPIMPIAPVVPVTPEVAPEPIPEDKPKKRASKKTKTAVKKEEALPKTDEKTDEKVEERVEKAEPPQEKLEEVKPVKEEKAVSAPKGTLMDMSFLFGEVKPAPKKPVVEPAPAQVAPVATAPKKAETEQKPKEKQEKKTEPKPQQKRTGRTVNAKKIAPTRVLTEEEKLQEAFLSKLRKLGGEYFEYYSVYLLERYSRMNGRRLEGLKITAGERDGGIDGEIELTDGLGFRETIYIQAKNWNPDKGDEKLWVVGETLLQQFIGACVCRQARDKKQRRGHLETHVF